MNECKDLEVLVSLRAAGALDPAESARVEAHLAACPACRAEADATASALAQAKLPPPTDAERRVLRDIPERTLDALHRADRRRGIVRRVLAGGLAAAAAAVVVLAPALLRKTLEPPAEATEETAWQEPDLDALWSDAQVVDFETSAQAGGDGADAALAALDDF